MTFCDNCGAKFYELPFHCRRCNDDFCSKCRLPEDHDCPGSVKKNIFLNLSRKKKHYYEVDEKYRREYVGIRHEHKKPNFYEQIKNYIKSRYHKIKYWLNSSHHRRYSNWNAFFLNILWIIVLTFSFLIIYSNLSKLNKIMLWFLPLGGTLLIINGLFIIKYIYRLLKRVYYWFECERNWVKYLILILILFLLWQAYQQKDIVFNPLIAFYNKIDFSTILPIKISEELKEKVNEVINPEPISQKTLDVEQAIFKYTNIQRKIRGLKELTWDAKLAEIAREHSLDMVKNNFFSHDNLKGEDPTARALRANYVVHKELDGGWYSEGIAENIGKMATGNVEGIGYVSSDADSISKAQVDSWMQSPGHRANILDSNHIKLGVGVAYDGTHYVVTQNFY